MRAPLHEASLGVDPLDSAGTWVYWINVQLLPSSSSPAMDYFVTRLYSQGRVTPKHVRHPVRGQLSVCEEHDAERNRVVKIARLVVPASVGKESPPPLHDVVMLGLTGDWLSLSGFERLAAGSLSELTSWAQTWLCCPAPIEDLIAAERRVDELSGRLHELTAGGSDRSLRRAP